MAVAPWKLLLLLISIPLFMYTTSVSLQHKIGYMVYSWHEIMTPRKDLQISDEGRLLTDHYALRGLAAHPWTGVGLGDVKPYMMQQILKDFPDYKGDVMLPHNQFLMAGLAGGMGMMLYVLLMTIICLIRARRTWISFVFCSIMVLAMLVEPLFETQYGTCIFLFFLLLLLQHGSRRV